MNVDLSYHFPPELNLLLVDAIPLLVKSKDDLLMFFRTAGISDDLAKDLAEQVRRDRNSISKYKIVREILSRLDAKGSAGVRDRREVVRRVVEFESYNSCYPEKVNEARGLVAEVQKVVNVKDSFTRMKDAQEAEGRKHREAQSAKAAELESRATKLALVKSDFYALFGETDAHKRGKKLESVLNRLFAPHGMLVREAFTVCGTNGQGVVEQIDGVVEIDRVLYLVEMKWWNEAIDPRDIGYHLSKIILRGNQCRGIYISYKGYTPAAIDTARQAIATGSLITLCDLQSVVTQMENGDLLTFLRARVHAAVLDKNPGPQ